MTSRPTSTDAPAAAVVEGDGCARHLIGRHPRSVVEVPLDIVVALLDIDPSEGLDADIAKSAR